MRKALLSLSAISFFFAATAQNVGIGETSPASKFSVKGNMSIGSGYSGTAAPANGAIIEGDMGVGTAAPISGGSGVTTLNIGRDLNTGSASDGQIVLSKMNGSGLFRSFKMGLDAGYNFSLGDFGGNGNNNYNPYITVNWFGGNVGIGTSSPGSRLTINGAASLTPSSGSAGATITIPANVSVFRITDDATSAANAVSATGPVEGQLLTILNNDAQAATFNSITIPASNGVGEFQYINSAWRLLGVSNGNAGWNITGNVSTSPATNYIGTSDAQDLSIRTQGVEHLRVLNGNATNNVLVVGNGEGTSTNVAGTIRATDASGTNIQGKDLFLRGGNGTGTSAGGSIFITGGGTSTGSSGNAYIRGGTNLNAGTGNVYLSDLGGRTMIGDVTGGPTQLLTMGNNTNSTTIRFSQRTRDAGGTVRFNVLGNDPVNGPYISWDNTLPFRFSAASDDGGGGWTERMRITNNGALAFNGATNFGNSGQILRSNGNAAPTWVDPGSTLTAGQGIGIATNTISVNNGVSGWVQVGTANNLPTSKNDFIYNNGNVGIGDYSSAGSATARLNVSVAADQNNNPANNGIYVYNPNNVGDNDDAIITARVGGAGAGDPMVSFDINGVAGWSMGIDNSDADKFKIGSNWDDPGTTPRLTIQTDGNVGIGTTTPGQRLTVVDAGNSNQYSGTFSVYANNLTQGVGIGYMGIQALGSNANQDLSFNARGTGNITMQVTGTTGNVGIGTTSPSYKLSVNGTIEAVDFGGAGSQNIRVGDDSYLTDVDQAHTLGVFSTTNTAVGQLQLGSNSGSYLFGSGGNIGIGTTTPSNRLHVAAGEGNGIDIGIPNDAMGFNGGSTSIRFYGYRDVVSNAIGAKISAERTNVCCGWLSQGTELAFSTNDGLVTNNADNSVERVRITGSGTLEAKYGMKTERQIRFYKRSRWNGQGGVDDLGNYDFCYLGGVAFRNSDSNIDEDDDYQCNVYSQDINGSAEYNEGENEDFTANFGFNSRPYWRLYSECYQDCSNSTCTAICINFDF